MKLAIIYITLKNLKIRKLEAEANKSYAAWIQKETK